MTLPLPCRRPPPPAPGAWHPPPTHREGCEREIWPMTNPTHMVHASRVTPRTGTRSASATNARREMPIPHTPTASGDAKRRRQAAREHERGSKPAENGSPHGNDEREEMRQILDCHGRGNGGAQRLPRI